MNRNKLIFSLFLFFSLFSVLTFGQESTSIAYWYKMPDVTSKNEVSKAHYQQLEQKIKSSYSKTNIFTTQSPFAIVPNIEVIDAKNAGEVQTVKVVKVAVSLSIEDLGNQIQFNQFETIVLATDNTLSLAISKAISQIKTSDPKFKRFFTEAEATVLAFYKDNCAKLIKSAKTNIERKEYNKAYAMLMYVPENTKCFDEVERLMTRIYVDTKEQNCQEMLYKAQIEKAEENYTQSLYFLNLIDPNTTCYADATKLLKALGALIKIESKKDFEMKKLEYEKKTELEKIKILAPQAEFLQIHR